MKGHGRLLPAVSATTARSRMGARVLASGMPVGIRLCGVSDATYSVVKVHCPS